MKDSTKDWQHLIEGQHAALERLYRAHAEALFRYGKQYADESTVADEVQSLFIKLWEKHATLNPNATPRPYLLISLRNALLKVVKKGQRVTSIEHEVTTPSASIEATIIAKEQSTEKRIALAEALQKLSTRERELIELRFLQELDYEEIVEITGISYQSSRNTIARAIGKLRNSLVTLLFFSSIGYNSMHDVLSICNPLIWNA